MKNRFLSIGLIVFFSVCGVAPHVYAQNGGDVGNINGGSSEGIRFMEKSSRYVNSMITHDIGSEYGINPEALLASLKNKIQIVFLAKKDWLWKNPVKLDRSDRPTIYVSEKSWERIRNKEHHQRVLALGAYIEWTYPSFTTERSLEMANQIITQIDQLE